MTTTPQAQAADRLRELVERAPRVQIDYNDDGVGILSVLTEEGSEWGTPSWVAVTPEEHALLRLVEVLLAAAPHLPTAINYTTTTEATQARAALRDAVAAVPE